MENAISLLFFVLFSSYLVSYVCPGLVIVSSPVAKSAYKQHKYKNKCIATGSTWTFSVGGVSAPLTETWLSSSGSNTINNLNRGMAEFQCFKCNQQS